MARSTSTFEHREVTAAVKAVGAANAATARSGLNLSAGRETHLCQDRPAGQEADATRMLLTPKHAVTPRGLSAAAAADYAGCQTVAAFHAWVRRGLMPKPMPGTRRYDRRAIDLALDQLSQITSHSAEPSAYEQWKRQNEGPAQRS